MLQLPHPGMLKPRPNKISGLKIEGNQLRKNQHLGEQLHLVD